MVIHPYRKYLIRSIGPDKLVHEWKLEITPLKRAWKIANMHLNHGDVLNGYQILMVKEIGKVTEPQISLHETMRVLLSDGDCPHCSGDLFGMICNNCGFDFNDFEKRECVFCGGTILEDRCLNCMFDWDC